MRSVVSSFQMLSYKIDKINLSMQNSLKNIQNRNFSDEEWSFGVKIRQPIYESINKVYIGGLDVILFYGNKENPKITLKSGIEGLFKVVGDDFTSEIENRVAKVQIPAILAPYLRSAITNILASAGFGSVMLPLLNMNAIAEDQLKEINIQRINEKKEASDAKNA